MEEQVTPPHASDAEHGLVNLAVHSAEHYYTLAELGITPEMFYSSHAAQLLGLLKQMTEEGNGSHPTQFNIRSRLKLLKLDDELAYYDRIFNEVVRPEWLTRYVNRVVDTYKKREFIKLSQHIAEMGYDSHLPSDAIHVQVSEALEQLEQLGRIVEIKNGSSIAKTMREFFDGANTRPAGSLWGVQALDIPTGGTRLGEFTMFKGMEGNGKSAFLQQVAYHRASVENPRPQLWITIGDMTTEQVMTRIMQQHSGVSSNQLSKGWFTDKENKNQWHIIDRELTRLGNKPFYIIEGGDLESKDLKRVIKRALRLEKNFDVYIDYLQQLGDKGDVYESTSGISRNLLQLAHGLRDADNQFQISLTAISGLNKDGEHFGAKRLAHDPENIFTIRLENPPGFEKAGKTDVVIDKVAKVFINKQRNGPSGYEVELYFQGRYTRFADIKK